MFDTGVVHSRFQILHLKQMEYLLAAKMRCKKLYIGITHPDVVFYAGTSSLDMHAITKRDNPLTYIERYEMLLGALEEFGVKREGYEIVPFPISHPDLIPQYAPYKATYYMSISSPWDEERLHILQNLGLETEVLWRRSESDRGITGSEIRSIIAEGSGEWQQFVPKSVAEYIKRNQIDRRIQELNHLYSPGNE